MTNPDEKSVPRIELVTIGGPGHPLPNCSNCDKKLAAGEGIATCTVDCYVTLCPDCYRAMGTSVR